VPVPSRERVALGRALPIPWRFFVSARDAAPATYRVEIYIVISKPKRMSSKDGLDHFIAISRIVFDNISEN